MDLIFDIGSLKKKKRVVLEGEIDMDYIELPMGNMPFLEPVKFKIVIVKAKEGVAVGGYVKTAIEHPCTRCLTPVRVEINGTIEALYLPASVREEGGEHQLESLKNVVYYDSPLIDLRERIIESIVIEVPQQVLCRPDCKGLCPVCGFNLNEDPEHHCDSEGSFSVDSRFAVLKKLKDKFEEG